MFTVRERLRFRAYQGLVMVPTEWTSILHKSQVSYSYLNQIDISVPEKKQGNLMELELQNVPKFDAEEYMPPEDDFRPVILFYYGGREMSSPDKFWEEWQRLITEYVEKFIGNSREVHDASMQAIGGETDPEKKLRKLFEDHPEQRVPELALLSDDQWLGIPGPILFGPLLSLIGAGAGLVGLIREVGRTGRNRSRATSAASRWWKTTS
jgi:hypothetical protein